MRFGAGFGRIKAKVEMSLGDLMSKLNGLELAFRGLSDEEDEDDMEIEDENLDEGFGEEEDDGSNNEV